MRTQKIDPQQTLEKSPLFRLSLSSKELFHSNFMEWLSIENREAFRKLINKMAGLDENQCWGTKNWFVKREFNNFDLCVVAYDEKEQETGEGRKEDNNEGEEGFRILFVVENKVKSIPYKKQLEEYEQEAREINNRYWRNKANKLFDDALESLDKVSNPWVVVENGKWALKKKNGRGKKATWSSSCIDSASGIPDGRYNKTAFLDDYAKVHQGQGGIYFVLLTLAETFPDQNEIKGWTVRLYSQYAEYIKENFLKGSFLKRKSLDYKIIDDYTGFIEGLTGLSGKWQQDYSDYANGFLLVADPGKSNYETARRLRIHDLYQKQKYSALCTDLYNRIKKKYERAYTVFPSNQGGLFKDVFYDAKGKMIGKGSNYICVNYEYMHGKPLLEINVHPACGEGKMELYYAIQVQGDDYEHGIQVKKVPGTNYSTIEKGKGKGTKEDIAKYAWDILKKKVGSQGIIKGWMNVSSSVWNEDCGFLSEIKFPKEGEFFRFIQSDGAYLYQKRIIVGNPSIQTIIDKMLADLDFVVKETNC